jgi:hypothetical protein
MVHKLAILNPAPATAGKIFSKPGKTRHRPVFFGTATTVGQRSKKAVLNKRKKKVFHKSKFTEMKNRRSKRRYGKRTNPFKKRFHRRFHRRRNPDVMSSTFTTANILGLGAGAIGGAVVYKFTTKLLQTEGNGKYLTGLGLAFAGWWLLSKFWKPGAVPFAAAVLAITANDYFTESGLLDGLLGYVVPSGLPISTVDAVNEWADNYSAAVNGVNGLGMITPNNGASVNLTPATVYGEERFVDRTQ